LISCGEASGDLYAAALTSAIRRRVPGVDVFGLGGPRLAAAGATLTADYQGLSVTGLVEALARAAARAPHARHAGGRRARSPARRVRRDRLFPTSTFASCR